VEFQQLYKHLIILVDKTKGRQCCQLATGSPYPHLAYHFHCKYFKNLLCYPYCKMSFTPILDHIFQAWPLFTK